jgi:hypothetical protein
MSQSVPGNGRQHRCRREKPQGNTPLTCRLEDGGPDVALALLDVSQNGIRLVVAEPLDAGRPIAVELERRGGHPPLQLRADVVWCMATAEQTYCVGARFHDYLPFSDLESIAGM